MNLNIYNTLIMNINSQFNIISAKIKDIQFDITRDELTNQAIEYFGTTKKPHEAGYILYNGEMLNFSGGYEDQRRLSHAEIYQMFTEKEYDELDKKYHHSGFIQLFQTHADAIRISVDRYGGYIYITIRNTQSINFEQLDTLRYIEKYDTERRIMYDVVTEDGYSINSGTIFSINDLKRELIEYIKMY